eukprot:g71394.t1
MVESFARIVGKNRPKRTESLANLPKRTESLASLPKRTESLANLPKRKSGQCERGGSQQWRRSGQRGCGERGGSQRRRSGQRGCGERGGSHCGGGVQGDGAVSAEAASTGLQIEDRPPAALAASSSSSSQAATGSPLPPKEDVAMVELIMIQEANGPQPFTTPMFSNSNTRAGMH